MQRESQGGSSWGMTDCVRTSPASRGGGPPRSTLSFSLTYVVESDMSPLCILSGRPLRGRNQAES